MSTYDGDDKDKKEKLDLKPKNLMDEQVGFVGELAKQFFIGIAATVLSAGAKRLREVSRKAISKKLADRRGFGVAGAAGAIGAGFGYGYRGYEVANRPRKPELRGKKQHELKKQREEITTYCVETLGWEKMPIKWLSEGLFQSHPRLLKSLSRHYFYTRVSYALKERETVDLIARSQEAVEKLKERLARKKRKKAIKVIIDRPEDPSVIRIFRQGNEFVIQDEVGTVLRGPGTFEEMSAILTKGAEPALPDPYDTLRGDFVTEGYECHEDIPDVDWFGTGNEAFITEDGEQVGCWYNGHKFRNTPPFGIEIFPKRNKKK